MKEYKWVNWEKREWSIIATSTEKVEMRKSGWKTHKVVWKGNEEDVLKGIVYYKNILWYKAIALFFKGKKHG